MYYTRAYGLPRGSNMVRASPTGRLGADDWVRAATDILVLKSVDAVRVESLARDLEVSKGSFYWHFKDRSELLRAILESWRQRQTKAIIERVTREEGLDPRERLRRTMELPLRSKASREAASLELAIRAWARRDKLARDAVAEVDAERLNFVSGQLIEAGADPPLAQQLSFIAYAYNLAEAWVAVDSSAQVRDQRRSHVIDLVFQNLPTGQAKSPKDRKLASAE